MTVVSGLSFLHDSDEILKRKLGPTSFTVLASSRLFTPPLSTHRTLARLQADDGIPQTLERRHNIVLVDTCKWAAALALRQAVPAAFIITGHRM